MDDQLLNDMRAIVDKEKIREVLANYVRAVDLYDIELLESVFHEDSIDCHGPETMTRDYFINESVPGSLSRDVCRHYLLNQLIDLDGASAHVETAVLIARKWPGQDTVELIGARFIDRMDKREGEWKIALRVVVVDWATEGTAARMAEIMAPFHRGARNASDPSYERPLQVREPVGSTT